MNRVKQFPTILHQKEIKWFKEFLTEHIQDLRHRKYHRKVTTEHGISTKCFTFSPTKRGPD